MPTHGVTVPRQRATTDTFLPHFTLSGGCDKESGFTLMELIVVLVVVGVLYAVALFVLNLAPSRGRAIYHEVTGTVQAAQYFAHNTGCYPADMAMLINSDETSGGTGLGGCQADLAHWHGPYLQGALTSGLNIALEDDVTGKQGSTLSINTGTWLSGTTAMSGRGNTEIALLAGPLTPQVQAAFCRQCGGCSPAASQSTCFTMGTNEVGYVFATQ